MGIDIPAAVVGVPAGAHGPHITIAFNIGDVGIAIGQQDSVLTLRLLPDEVHKVCKRDLLSVTKFLADRGVEGIFPKTVNGETIRCNSLLLFSQEHLPEIVPGANIGLLDDLFGKNEVLNERYIYGGELGEELNPLDFHLSITAENAQDVVHSTNLVDQCFNLTEVQFAVLHRAPSFLAVCQRISLYPRLWGLTDIVRHKISITQ
ncbi:MAG: hypothetical protein A3D35_01510 [Candidatus Staskawiczbacteria bacterium RIFCSPHIGHO2_02_FULL_34_9]|uniref:Uncharacterized protein n=1 Tax=Candidatus Staskawiczbacteria bacterium RIFCSPHIGHO2_02_FULL_34_9 TaxID=1802206 RepID=A0A1G2HYY2_9BACT|nr:MAG: hypothetical protein A3D35_01510 [Candidatus Staskawiczbacteria bacterium RIFCSPHIGHO2_02_FULL_34_9]